MASTNMRYADPRSSRVPRSNLLTLGVEPLKQRLYSEDKDPYWPLLRELAAQSKDVLVFGAGRGSGESDLRGEGRRVSGLDVAAAVRENPFLDEAICYDGTRFPLQDASFDMCCSYSVLEHLEAPLATFREIARVLRPGGRFVFRTTNGWFYASLFARLIPNRFHGAVVHFATGRAEEDTFPTYYRANTRGRLRSLMRAVGLTEVQLHVHLRGAGYLEFSLPTFLLGVLYERIVNGVAMLEDLRASIVGDFVKTA